MSELLKDEAPHTAPKKRILRTAGSIIVSLVLAFVFAVFALVLIRDANGIAGLMHSVSTLRLYGFSIQISLIGLLWWKWDQIINWLVDSKRFPEVSREILLEKRHRWMGFLFLVEVFMFVFTTPMSGK